MRSFMFQRSKLACLLEWSRREGHVAGLVGHGCLFCYKQLLHDLCLETARSVLGVSTSKGQVIPLHQQKMLVCCGPVVSLSHVIS